MVIGPRLKVTVNDTDWGTGGGLTKYVAEPELLVTLTSIWSTRWEVVGSWCVTVITRIVSLPEAVVLNVTVGTSAETGATISDTKTSINIKDMRSEREKFRRPPIFVSSSPYFLLIILVDL